jgi:hypothetical protein
MQIHPFALYGVKTNFSREFDEKLVQEAFESIGLEAPDHFELRGEAVIPKDEYTYKKYGEYSVWRSTVAGIFNRKLPANPDGLIEYFRVIGNDYQPDSNGVFTILEREDALLMASLSTNENLRFSTRAKDLGVKYDSKNKKLFVIHHDNSIEFLSDLSDEKMDIVLYSMSLNGSNVDNPVISKFGKYVSEIQFEERHRQELIDEHVKPSYRKTHSKQEIIDVVNEFYGCDKDGKRDYNLPRLRNMYEYAIDGIVIKPSDSNNETQGLSIRNAINNPSKIVVPKYPEDQIAVKYLSEKVTVKLDHIDRRTTKLGNVTLTGVLDHPYRTESNGMVSNLNLHNPEWLEMNPWIKEGGTYDMIMSCDIIPILLKPEV